MSCSSTLDINMPKKLKEQVKGLKAENVCLSNLISKKIIIIIIMTNKSILDKFKDYYTRISIPTITTTTSIAFSSLWTITTRWTIPIDQNTIPIDQNTSSSSTKVSNDRTSISSTLKNECFNIMFSFISQ